MKIKDLFFHIHYCNYRQFSESGRYSRKITKTLQHHEFGFIRGGNGYFTIENKRYPIKEGVLFYICPNVLHTMEIDVEKPGCFLSVHFSYAHVSYNEDGWDVKNGSELFPIHSVQALKDFYHIEDLFKKLADGWNTKLPGYEFITRTLLQELLIAIYQNNNKQNHNYATSLKVERIIQYLHQNINNKVSLDELSEVVQLAPTYLSRAFKKTTGYSVIEFFNKIKIDKSKELMLENDKKVKEVAQALGFTDEFYFSRLFKRIEGISPSEFYSNNVHGV